jgi:S-(hydroxymethyl)mycothiol dehydrogenase
VSETIRTEAVVVRAAGEASRVETILVDPPGPGEARVRILASGVCHSDLHAKLGDFGTEFPYLLGHEGAGIVESVGTGVTAVKAGDSVMIEWRAPCRTCKACARGAPQHCAKPLYAAPRMKTEDGKTLGRVLGIGSFTQYTVVHATQCIPVAAEVNPEASCLIGCGVATGLGAALRAAEVGIGDTVAVVGCGAVGMSAIQGARLAQAGKVIAVDRVAAKLDLARRLGATDVVDASAAGPDVVKQVRALSGGGVDWAFEAVGGPETVATAMGCCGLGGTCVMIGVPSPKAELRYPLARLFYGRVTLRPTFYGDVLATRDFPIFVEMYRRGTLDLDALISERIALGDVEAAFAKMQRGETVRSVIRF